MSAIATTCLRASCSRPVAPSAGNRPRRYCSRACLALEALRRRRQVPTAAVAAIGPDGDLLDELVVDQAHDPAAWADALALVAAAVTGRDDVAGVWRAVAAPAPSISLDLSPQLNFDLSRPG